MVTALPERNSQTAVASKVRLLQTRPYTRKHVVSVWKIMEDLPGGGESPTQTACVTAVIDKKNQHKENN